MKKSELRQLIREEIANIHEQGGDPGIPWVCMNLFETADAIDDGQSGLNSSEGYCVNTMIGGSGALHQQFQNAGFGTYTMHNSLDECINDYNAGGNCNQAYTHSVYPPPTTGPIDPIKGPAGNLYTNYANKPKKAVRPKPPRPSQRR